MLGSFELDMSRLIAHTNANINTVTKKVVLDIARSVIRKSPVDTGRFKGNWQYSAEEMPAGVTDIHDETGAGTQVHIASQIPQQAAGKLHWIVNNLPYSIALENGHSNQAPRGMVGLTVSEYQSLVQHAVTDVNP